MDDVKNPSNGASLLEDTVEGLIDRTPEKTYTIKGSDAPISRDNKNTEHKHYVLDKYSPEKITGIETELERELAKYGITEENIFKLVYSVQEAIKNQHEHTHKKNKEKRIFIDLKVSKFEPHYAEISVRADGAAPDFVKIDEAAKILDSNEPYMGDRTRGLGMIRDLCDEAYIHSKGPRTEYRLIKYKQARQAGN